jgi:hypothetical protein
MPDWLKRISALAAKGLGQMVTEKDNATLDIKRIAGAVALVFVTVCKTYDFAWRHGPLEFMATCQGLALLVGALGASIAINRNTENGG